MAACVVKIINSPCLIVNSFVLRQNLMIFFGKKSIPQFNDFFGKKSLDDVEFFT